MLFLSVGAERTRHISYYAYPSKSTVSQSGFSLLEVLISLLIFTIGMLGLVSLQHLSLQLSRDASFQQQASNLSASLRTHFYTGGSEASLSDWEQTVRSTLPQGKSTLTEQNGIYHLEISWFVGEQSEAGGKEHYQTRFVVAP